MSPLKDEAEAGARSRRPALRWLVLIALLVTLPLCALEVSYRLALTGLPSFPQPVELPDAEALAWDWRELGGSGEIRVKPLYPWGFLHVINLDELHGGLRAARWVAQWHLFNLEDQEKIEPTASWRRELQLRALIIWLSRHWSGEQLVGWHYGTLANIPKEVSVRTEHMIADACFGCLPGSHTGSRCTW